MTTRVPPFTPRSMLDAGEDPITHVSFPTRASTTEEQRREAIADTLAWMAEHLVWLVEREVRWTRYPATVLRIRGHAEHLRGRVLGVRDEVTEADLEGRAIVVTLAERQRILEDELTQIWPDRL